VRFSRQKAFAVILRLLLISISNMSSRLAVFYSLGVAGVGGLEAGGITINVFVNSVCCGGKFTGLGGHSLVGWRDLGATRGGMWDLRSRGFG